MGGFVRAEKRHPHRRRPGRLHPNLINRRRPLAPTYLQVESVVIDIPAVRGDFFAVVRRRLFECLNCAFAHVCRCRFCVKRVALHEDYKNQRSDCANGRRHSCSPVCPQFVPSGG